MNMGYTHIVSITNGIHPNWVFEFREMLKTSAPSPELLIEAIKRPDVKLPTLHLYEGHECIWCIQDGEMRGYGIYVFFKTLEGAEKCAEKWGRLVERSNGGWIKTESTKIYV